MNRLDRLARRFPLVARPRPACPPLDVRVRQVCDLARAAADTPAADRLAVAASAHNKAALIASDCGLPDLARSLSWQQFDTYRHARPLGSREARYALEPLVNLARLHIRDGDGQAAYNLLDTLHRAVTAGTEITIDGQTVNLAGLTATRDDRRDLRQWLWAVLLADGTRALTSAGQWNTALAHVEQHHGIGRRLLDGRQAAVLAHCMTGDPATARTILDDSTPAEPWEHAVAACLTVLCLASAGDSTDSAASLMVERYLGLDTAPESLVFRTRLGLTVVDLADGAGHSAAGRIVTHLTAQAGAAGNGYVARDLLTHPPCTRRMTAAEKHELSAIARSSGLGCRDIPAGLLTDLRSAVAASETVTRRCLASPSQTCPTAES